jgi:hypothetical protein
LGVLVDRRWDWWWWWWDWWCHGNTSAEAWWAVGGAVVAVHVAPLIVAAPPPINTLEFGSSQLSWCHCPEDIQLSLGVKVRIHSIKLGHIDSNTWCLVIGALLAHCKHLVGTASSATRTLSALVSTTLATGCWATDGITLDGLCISTSSG